MYKVFINKYSLILTNKSKKRKKFLTFPLKLVKLVKVIDQIISGELKNVCLFHPDEENVLNVFSKKIPIVVAGGGLVRNNKGEILFIFRNGKWDLPKGKLDKGETIEEAAVREVEEETGVSGLKIGKLIRKTYHIFQRNGIYKLKETYWYEMYTEYDGELVGQIDEGIEKVVWKKEEKINKALKNSYQNIKHLLKEYQPNEKPSE